MLDEILEIGRRSVAVASALNEFLRESEGWFSRQRLTLGYDEDISGWVRHMRTAVQADGINPTFDPERSPISPCNSYWLDVKDCGGRTVACIAVRMVHTDDFVRHISSMRLWFDPLPAGMGGPLDLVLPPDTPVISGAVAHYGGHWVHPSWRGKGLPGVLLPLAKILTIELFRSDWDTGIVFLKNARKQDLLAAYGFARTELCYSGSFPPANRDDTLFLTYSSREQTLSALPSAITRLRREPLPS
ncbi:hypothetical protein OG589_19860 [Sphaerisporangium sp. NBC_01403]|uniref:hypothetical protein n=1 Tax=Sphaerisporangium sp. NBC_01403 TaxID=2903599 RepID=UPI0032488E18